MNRHQFPNTSAIIAAHAQSARFCPCTGLLLVAEGAFPHLFNKLLPLGGAFRKGFVALGEGRTNESQHEQSGQLEGIGFLHFYSSRSEAPSCLQRKSISF